MILTTQTQLTPSTTPTQHSHKENLTWKEVTKSEPCPCCGKPDWCSVGKDGRGEILAILCNRDAQPPSNDWVEVKRSKEDHPIYSLRNDNYLPQPLRKTKPRKQERPAPIPEKIELARLPEPGQPPEIKPLQHNWLREKGVPDNATEQRFSYSETQWVSRFQWADPTKPKGYNKTIRQAHIDENGKTVWKKGDREWLPYHFDEVEKYGKNKTVIMGEGETVVEALRSKLGLVSTTLQGSAWNEPEVKKLVQLLLKAGVLELVFFPDHDDTGYKKAKMVQAIALQHKLRCVIINPIRLWNQMPSKGDVVDWIEGNRQMSQKDFIKRLEKEIHAAVAERAGADRTKKEKRLKEAYEIKNTRENEPLSTEELLKALEELIELDPPQSELGAKINDLAKAAVIQPREVWRMYHEKVKEVETESDRSLNQAELDNLLKAKSARIDLKEMLPEKLAAPIIELASRLSLRPECYLTALLTGVSTLHNTDTRVILNEAVGFTVTPNLFSAIVAPSSQKKSPIVKAMISDPLAQLQAKAREQYQEEYRLYEENLAQYKGLEKRSPEKLAEKFPNGRPIEPRQKLYYFTNATGEGIINQVQAHPEKPLLYLKDELAGMFKSFGQYKGGRGSEEEDLLSFYDGTGGTILRAKGTTADLHGLLLSIFGGIQQGVLQKLLHDFQDSNGKWARFMFVVQPLAASELNPDESKFILSDMIGSLYQRCSKYLSQPKTYKLTKSAAEYFCRAYNRLEKLRTDIDTSRAMSNVWGKSEGRIGKLAINLHVIKAVFNGQSPNEFIDRSTIKAAVQLTNFYARQVESLYSELEDETALTPTLARILELAERKNDWITARDVSRGLSAKNRPDTGKIRSYFQELAQMEKGELGGSGNKLKFRIQKSVDKSVDSGLTVETHIKSTFEKSVDKNVDNVDKSVDTLSTVETHTESIFEKNVDNVDTLSPTVNHTEETEFVDTSPPPEKNNLRGEESDYRQNDSTPLPEPDTDVDTESTLIDTSKKVDSSDSLPETVSENVDQNVDKDNGVSTLSSAEASVVKSQQEEGTRDLTQMQTAMKSKVAAPLSEVEVDSKIQSSAKSDSSSEVEVKLKERSEAINDLAWFLTGYAEGNAVEDLLSYLFEGYPEGDKLNDYCQEDLFLAALERLDGKEREWVESVIEEYKKPMFSVGDRVIGRCDFDSIRNGYVGVITSISSEGQAEIRFEHPVKNSAGGMMFDVQYPVRNLTHFEGEAPIPVEPKPFKKPEVSTKSESDEKPEPEPKATQLDLGIVVQQPEPPLGDYWE